LPVEAKPIAQTCSLPAGDLGSPADSPSPFLADRHSSSKVVTIEGAIESIREAASELAEPTIPATDNGIASANTPSEIVTSNSENPRAPGSFRKIFIERAGKKDDQPKTINTYHLKYHLTKIHIFQKTHLT
jgi:hypothetical protein